jgi:hypothetical protein
MVLSLQEYPYIASTKMPQTLLSKEFPALFKDSQSTINHRLLPYTSFPSQAADQRPSCRPEAILPPFSIPNGKAVWFSYALTLGESGLFLYNSPITSDYTLFAQKDLK